MTIQKAITIARESPYVPDTKFAEHIATANQQDIEAKKSSFVQHTQSQLTKKDVLLEWLTQ